MSSKLKKIGIIVARMGSSRLPRKALIPLAGIPAIDWVLNSVRGVKGLDKIILATSTLPHDDQLAEHCMTLGCEVYRGHPDYVLDRVYECARAEQADVVMHFGGDCPLLDVEMSSEALATFLAGDYDYLSNYEPPTFPEGLDINILRFSAIERAFKEAIAPSQRIHAYSYLTWHPELFKLKNFERSENLSHLHWSLDFPEDFAFINGLLEKVAASKAAHAPGISKILETIESDQNLKRLHSALVRPQKSHAFWNSPGIIRDMHSDIAELAKEAADFVLKNKVDEASLRYQEIDRIMRRLETMVKEQKKAGR